MGYYAGSKWVSTTEEDKKREAPTLKNWNWKTATSPLKPVAQTPVAKSGGAGYEPEWTKIRTPATPSSTFTGTVGGTTKAATPGASYEPKPSVAQSGALAAPTDVMGTLNKYLSGTPFSPTPVYAASGDEPTAEKKVGMWDWATPWKETEGEKAGDWWSRITSGGEAKTSEGDMYTSPVTGKEHPTYPTQTQSASKYWWEGGEQYGPPTAAQAQTPEYVKSAKVGLYGEFPEGAAALEAEGMSPEEISKMTGEDYDKLVEERTSQERQESGLEGQRNSVIQQLYQMGYSPDYTNSLTTEQLFAILEGQKDIKGKEDRAETREEHFSPEEVAYRQKQYDESQQRAMKAYWSPEQVVNREKQREEGRKSSTEHELRGFDTYFDFLDDMKLAPDANNYFDNPARLRELRDRWEATGKSESWLTFLKKYDFKGEHAYKTYRSRMGRAAEFAPRMRSVSF